VRGQLQRHIPHHLLDQRQERCLTALAAAPSLLTENPRLWEALLTVLRLGPAVLYFPGDAPPLVASFAAGDQLPTDMVEAMGRPWVVMSAEEIVRVIK
jgi:hypothetical protein